MLEKERIPREICGSRESSVRERVGKTDIKTVKRPKYIMRIVRRSFFNLRKLLLQSYGGGENRIKWQKLI